MRAPRHTRERRATPVGEPSLTSADDDGCGGRAGPAPLRAVRAGRARSPRPADVHRIAAGFPSHWRLPVAAPARPLGMRPTPSGWLELAQPWPASDEAGGADQTVTKLAERTQAHRQARGEGAAGEEVVEVRVFSPDRQASRPSSGGGVLVGRRPPRRDVGHCWRQRGRGRSSARGAAPAKPVSRGGARTGCPGRLRARSPSLATGLSHAGAGPPADFVRPSARGRGCRPSGPRPGSPRPSSRRSRRRSRRRRRGSPRSGRRPPRRASPRSRSRCGRT